MNEKKTPGGQKFMESLGKLEASGWGPLMPKPRGLDALFQDNIYQLSEEVTSQLGVAVRANAERYIESTFHAMAGVISDGHCESPIEEAMLLALWVAAKREFMDVQVVTYDKDGRRQVSGDRDENRFYSCIIRPQFNVDKYRADFLVSFDVAGHAFPYPLRVSVIVECDGHNFHEKTKEQAKRDKARDRKLQSHGYPVLRFTGSETWNDPFKHAAEVCAQLNGMMATEEKKKKTTAASILAAGLKGE